MPQLALFMPQLPLFMPQLLLFMAEKSFLKAQLPLCTVPQSLWDAPHPLWNGPQQASSAHPVPFRSSRLRSPFAAFAFNLPQCGRQESNLQSLAATGT